MDPCPNLDLRRGGWQLVELVHEIRYFGPHAKADGGSGNKVQWSLAISMAAKASTTRDSKYQHPAGYETSFQGMRRVLQNGTNQKGDAFSSGT